MSRLPIRIRLTLAFAIVMTVVFSAVGTILYIRLGDALDERIADSLEARTSALAATLDVTSPAVTGEDGVSQVLESDGSVVAGSPAFAEVSALSAAQLTRALVRPITVEREISGVDFRLVATPVDDVVVVVGESLDDRDEALGGLLTQLLVVLPVALLVSALVGYVVAGAALRPMEAMRGEAAEISSSSPDRRLPLPPARDEVYRLGETLNDMLGRLEAGLERERRFVADASHELRTPLAVLKAELEVALRHPRSAEELELALRSAAEETDRLVQLAEDLLVIARADQGALGIEPEPVPVDELLAEVAKRFRGAAGARVIDVASSGTVVEADRTRLGQAVGNLVSNALGHGAGTVVLHAVARGGTVELHVTDEGVGLDPDFVPVAFERFSRADDARSQGGTGLGLAIVAAVARAHGGSVGAGGRPGGGADVWIAVPTRLNPGHAARGDRVHLG